MFYYNNTEYDYLSQSVMFHNILSIFLLELSRKQQAEVFLFLKSVFVEKQAIATHP